MSILEKSERIGRELKNTIEGQHMMLLCAKAARRQKRCTLTKLSRI